MLLPGTFISMAWNMECLFVQAIIGNVDMICQLLNALPRLPKNMPTLIAPCINLLSPAV
jgi:hypothetical protein